MMTRESSTQKKRILNILLFILIFSFCNISNAYREHHHHASRYHYEVSVSSLFIDTLELALTSAQLIIAGSLIAGTLLVALPVAICVIPIAGIVIAGLALAVVVTTARLMLIAAIALPITIAAFYVAPAIITIHRL